MKQSDKTHNPKIQNKHTICSLKRKNVSNDGNMMTLSDNRYIEIGPDTFEDKMFISSTTVIEKTNTKHAKQNVNSEVIYLCESSDENIEERNVLITAVKVNKKLDKHKRCKKRTKKT